MLDQKIRGIDKILTVQVNSSRGEDYKEPPPPKYIAFSGSATTLGGEAPLSSTVETSHQVKAEPPKVEL